MTEPTIWRLTIAYHGKGFAGWQRQDGVRTVEAELRAALARLASGGEVRVRAAGRTDAGVHAAAQTVSVSLVRDIAPDKLPLALNAHLPGDVSVLSAEVMPAEFDAKRSSIGKRYRYHLLARRARDPLRADTSWHLRAPVDIAAMRAAAVHLMGEHDYESFRHTHCDAKHARRYLWKIAVEEGAEGRVTLEVRGNAFCRNMVRILAGTLADVGRGRYTPDDVLAMRDARDRTQAGQTAPAHGLVLERVYYPDTAEEAEIPEGASFPGWPPG